MIPWVTVRPALEALFARLSGVPALATHTRDGGTDEFAFPADEAPADAAYAESGTGGPITLTFHLVRVDTIGRDEQRMAYDEDAVIAGDTSGVGGAAVNGGMIYTATGPRIVHVEATIETWDQLVPAHDYMRRFRDRLTLPSARTELTAVGLALSEAGHVTDAAYEDEEGRMVSAYSCELWFNAFSEESDDAITTIDRVNHAVEEPA